jgi:hypothetical protein
VAFGDRYTAHKEEGTTVRNPAPWTDVNLGLAAEIRDESHGGCQVNGPKVAKFLDR